MGIAGVLKGIGAIEGAGEDGEGQLD